MLSLLFLALGAAQPAVSAPTLDIETDAPIDMSAERCEILENQDVWKCAGDVRITQGDAILVGQSMTIYGVSEEGGFRRIEAEGGVRYAQGLNAISGDRGTYDATNTTLTVSGDVVVVQGEQVMTGGELTYNTETGATVFTPDATGRVRGLFYTQRSAD